MFQDQKKFGVIPVVEDLGKLDNALIIYISGDGGGSAEGAMGRS
jgi:hypothetical protein